MKLLLKIADLNFSIDSFYDAYFKEATEEYTVETEHVDVKIKVDMESHEICEPTGKKLTERSVANWYMTDNGVYQFYLRDPGLNAYTANFLYNNHEKSVQMTLLDVKSLFNIDPIYFLYNCLEMVFNFVMLFHDGFEVHASSVVYNNTGLAFSAVSGTGKSTHTGLWLKNYPGTVILNDDKPVMRFLDGEWRIYGTPWAGTTGINKNLCVPLKALVFLERSENNTIRDCVGAEAIKRFFEAVVHPVSDETVDLLLNLLTLLIKHNRICVLGCNMTDDAPETVRKFLYD